MPETLQFWLAIGGAFASTVLTAIAGTVWIVRLEGRVNVQEVQITQIAGDVRYLRTRFDEVHGGKK